jgi:hypothetical protein
MVPCLILVLSLNPRDAKVRAFVPGVLKYRGSFKFLVFRTLNILL